VLIHFILTSRPKHCCCWSKTIRSIPFTTPPPRQNPSPKLRTRHSPRSPPMTPSNNLQPRQHLHHPFLNHHLPPLFIHADTIEPAPPLRTHKMHSSRNLILPSRDLLSARNATVTQRIVGVKAAVVDEAEELGAGGAAEERAFGVAVAVAAAGGSLHAGGMAAEAGRWTLLCGACTDHGGWAGVDGSSECVSGVDDPTHCRCAQQILNGFV
jgi:hypothetical protein